MYLVFSTLFLASLALECSPPADCAKFCRIKYQGIKSFYNSTDGNCYKVISCMESEIFDIENNVCIAVNQNLPNVTTGNNTNDETTFEDKPIKCVNGNWVLGFCDCYDGFKTSSTQNVSSTYIYQCNILDEDTEDDSSFTEGSNGELYLESQQEEVKTIGRLSLIEMIGILAGFTVFLMLITCCIRKKIQKKFLVEIISLK